MHADTDEINQLLVYIRWLLPPFILAMLLYVSRRSCVYVFESCLCQRIVSQDRYELHANLDKMGSAIREMARQQSNDHKNVLQYQLEHLNQWKTMCQVVDVLIQTLNRIQATSQETFNLSQGLSVSNWVIVTSIIRIVMNYNPSVG